MLENMVGVPAQPADVFAYFLSMEFCYSDFSFTVLDNNDNIFAAFYR